MEELRQTIQEHGIWYQLKGDYYLPVWNCRKKTAPLAAGGGSIKRI